MPYANIKDQRRADLAWYHKNAELVKNRRKERRRLRAAALTKDDVNVEQILKRRSEERSKRAQYLIEKEEERQVNLRLKKTGEKYKYIYQKIRSDFDDSLIVEDIYAFILSNGDLGKYCWFPCEYSKLYTCTGCGKVGIRKKVCHRDGISRLNIVDQWKFEYSFNPRSLLCWSCYNKAKPIAKKTQQTYELLMLAKKLKNMANAPRKLSGCRGGPKKDMTT